MKYTTALITLAAVTTAAANPNDALFGKVPSGPDAFTTTRPIAARQAEVTVNAQLGDGIRKADHDDDSAEFRSGVGSFVSKVTSVVGDVFQGTTTPTPTPTPTPAAGTKEDPSKKGSGAGMMSPRDGASGYLLTAAVALLGAGAYFF